MKQIVWIINCYLYGATLILLVVLALLVYLRGQANHLPNPFVRKNIVYRSKEKAQGVLLGKKFGLLAYSPEQDEGHILVMGPSGTGKTSALLIPTLRSWQGTALVVDISGDISANVHTENKIIFDPTAADCIPYDAFASIDAAPDDTERQERLEQLAYLLLPDKANDSEAGVFFTKNGRKMITAALICYYGMGWGFIEICEFFLGHDWRSLLNDIAKQENTAANAYISYSNPKYSTTDNGSGRLFSDIVKGQARYVASRKSWFIYDGTRWVPDEGNMATMEMCKTIGDALTHYAFEIKDEKERREYLRYTMSNEELQKKIAQFEQAGKAHKAAQVPYRPTRVTLPYHLA